MREGWTAVSLRDVATLVRGVSYKSSDLTDRAGVPLVNLRCVGRGGGYRPEGIKWFSGAAKASQRAGPGDLLIANTDLTRGMAVVGCPVLLPSDGSVVGSVFSLDLTKLVVDATRTTSAFLNLVLSQPAARVFMQRHTSGTTVMHLRVREVGGLSLLLPPLAEQRRIVDLIDAVDRASGGARHAADASHVALRAYVREHFGTTDEPRRPLGELVGFASGYAFPVVRQGGGGGSIPFFKVSDMNAAGNGVVLRSAANYVDEATLQAMRAKTWAEGTVVFPKVGAALLTEKRRLLGQRSAFDNNVMGLVPNREVTPRFLYWFMTTVRLGEYAQHGAVPSVNQGHLASIAIPVPSLSEQEEFCATADALQGLAAACSTTATAMSTVRSALLADLLAGEHEIPESYDRLLDAVA